MCVCVCVCVQGYNDNSGLGPILAQYLEDDSDQGQILAVVINQLGDNQMNTYFTKTGSSTGMMCDGETSSDDAIFRTIKETHQKSFQDLGGEYIERDNNEQTCAVRLATNAFFEVIVAS